MHPALGEAAQSAFGRYPTIACTVHAEDKWRILVALSARLYLLEA